MSCALSCIQLKTQLNAMTDTYQNAKSKLTNAKNKNKDLSELMKKFVNQVADLECQLSEALTFNQADYTLYALISIQKEQLDYQPKSISTLNKRSLICDKSTNLNNNKWHSRSQNLSRKKNF